MGQGASRRARDGGWHGAPGSPRLWVTTRVGGPLQLLRPSYYATASGIPSIIFPTVILNGIAAFIMADAVFEALNLVSLAT